MINTRSQGLQNDKVVSKVTVVSAACRILKHAPNKTMRFVDLANSLFKEVGNEMAEIKKHHFKIIEYFSKVSLFEVRREPKNDMIRLSPYLEAAIDAHSFQLLRQSLSVLID